MKKLGLIFGMIVFTFSMNAQNKTFTLPENEGEQLKGQYIVIDEKGTPQENYNKVINYINKTYNTPSEVIKSEISGEYIKIEGISDLFKNGGVMIPVRHTLEFKFKQDKIKMTVLNLTGAGTSTASVIAYCTYDKTHNSRGKVKKSIKYYNRVTDGLNALAERIKLGIAEESSTDTDDDW